MIAAGYLKKYDVWTKRPMEAKNILSRHDISGVWAHRETNC